MGSPFCQAGRCAPLVRSISVRYILPNVAQVSSIPLRTRLRTRAGLWQRRLGYNWELYRRDRLAIVGLAIFALFPLVTSFLLAMAFTLDASIITESIFSWPGIGLALLHAFISKDMPLAIGIIVFLGAVASVAHLLIDLLYAYLDPRIRYVRK